MPYLIPKPLKLRWYPPESILRPSEKRGRRPATVPIRSGLQDILYTQNSFQLCSALAICHGCNLNKTGAVCQRFNWSRNDQCNKYEIASSNGASRNNCGRSTSFKDRSRHPQHLRPKLRHRSSGWFQGRQRSIGILSIRCSGKAN